MRYKICVFDKNLYKTHEVEFSSNPDDYTEEATKYTPQTSSNNKEDNITWVEIFNGSWKPVENYDSERKNEAQFLLREADSYT